MGRRALNSHRSCPVTAPTTAPENQSWLSRRNRGSCLMWRYVMLMLGLVVSAGQIHSGVKEGKGEKEVGDFAKLAGKWQLMTVVHDGKPMPPEKKSYWRIAKNKVIYINIRDDGTEMPGDADEITVDASKKPRSMD